MPKSLKKYFLSKPKCRRFLEPFNWERISPFESWKKEYDTQIGGFLKLATLVYTYIFAFFELKNLAVFAVLEIKKQAFPVVTLPEDEFFKRNENLSWC